MRALADLGGYRRQERAHRLRGSTFLADDLANVLFGDAQLDEAVALAGDLGHDDLVGVVHELHRDGLDQIFEGHRLTSPERPRASSDASGGDPPSPKASLRSCASTPAAHSSR